MEEPTENKLVDKAVLWLERNGVSGDAMVELNDKSGSVMLYQLLACFAKEMECEVAGCNIQPVFGWDNEIVKWQCANCGLKE